MDEQTFDDSVKERLVAYKDPGDDYAFDALKTRLETRQQSISFNQKSINTISYAAAGLILILTAINVALTFRSVDIQNSEPPTKQVDSLLNVINKLRSDADFLEGELACVRQGSSQKQGLAVIQTIDKKDEISETINAPGEPKRHPRTIFVYPNHDFASLSPRLTIPTREFVFINNTKTVKSARKQNEIPASIRNKLERHYFNGIGINLAPLASFGVASINSSVLTPVAGFGLGADWIVSPHLSVETSVRYSAFSYSAPKDDPAYYTYGDKYYGAPAQVTQRDNAIIGSALLGYRQWITTRDQLSLKFGFARYETFYEKFIIEYSQGGYGDPDDRGSITQTRRTDGIRNLGNILSLNAGIERRLDRNHKLELSAFYDYSIGKNHVRHFGIRTALWFKVRQ